MSYRELFRMGAPRRLAAASLVGLLAIGMIGLTIVLAVERATGSFTAAGAASGAFALGAAALAPARGRLVDRHGPGRALPAFGASFAAVLCGLALATLAEASPWLLGALAALAGAVAPPLVATARTLWPHLVGEPHVRPGYAVSAAVADTAMVVGPLVAAALVAAVVPAVALLACGALSLAGTVGVGRLARRAGVGGHGRPAGRRLGALASRGMRVVVAAGVPLGLALGLIEVTMPAIAVDRGQTALAGILLAAFAAGSAVAGLWAGSRAWESSPGSRFGLALGGLAASLAGLAVVPWLGARVALLVTAGACFGPASVALFELLDVLAPRGTGTEALTWITTAEAAGAAAGSVAAGVLVTHASEGAALAAAAAAAGTGALIAWLWRARLEPGQAAL